MYSGAQGHSLNDLAQQEFGTHTGEDAALQSMLQDQGTNADQMLAYRNVGTSPTALGPLAQMQWSA